ncbi:MAG: YceD family protein, partial [Actinomycetota bacterium]|nr:YceD family protein [Actinomycetota bacterium]
VVTVAESLPGARVALARLSTEAPLSAELRLESVVEGILVTGPASAPAAFECARCLKQFRGEVELEVCELFAAPGHLDSEEDAYRVEGEEIDLEPMLRDAVTLALPLNPLCDPDCRGLCAQCGREMARHTEECTQDATDPRWADLDVVRAKLQN